VYETKYFQRLQKVNKLLVQRKKLNIVATP